MSDDKKLTVSGRSTLGVGKGMEAGQVRQSFSHGRSKAVVVERKRKRVVGAPGAKPAVAAAVGERPAVGTKPQPKPRAYKPKRPAGADGTLTNTELETRAKVLEEAKRRAEADAIRQAQEAEARAKREAEASERAELDAESAAKSRAEDAARKQAEDVARKKAEAEAERKAEEDRVRREKAEEDARRKAELEARAVKMRQASGAKAPGAADATEGRGGKPKRTRERKGGNDNQATQRPRGGENRRRGRLTVSNALDGGDERQRSIAAFKRAQAKQKRRLMGGEEPERQRQNREIVVPEAITVQELANRMAEKAGAVIKTLMKLGVMATINEMLDQDTAELVVAEFGHTIKRVSESDVEIGLIGDQDVDTDLQHRAPVVTVMGHVDHGKTSLLDALREANVVAGEAGGITQHIGAYQVTVGDNKITFLDTPGHAAFTQMRARGAKVTDIVILVVAADDGVMPQTIEAINHAKAAEVPLIVAINKIDREGATPDRVRQELLQHEVVVESYSGDVQEVEVSALKKTGLDALKEAINLQAELLELKANPNRGAEGVVVEAKLDKGRGPLATALIQRGTLSVGDIVVAGAEWGKVRALVNDKGDQVKSAGPSEPVEVLGLNATPGAGDVFAVVENEARAREVTEYRQRSQQKSRQASAGPKTLETMFSQLKDNEQISFDVVLKADVQGSVEAITQALEKAGNDDITCRVIHGAVGGITESDITLAEASNALVIGFNVRPNKQARDAAEQAGITVKYYSIIYDLIDEVKAAMAGELGPEYQEEVIGRAQIKEVFSAGKAGRAAGCMVVDGQIKQALKARILRDDVIVYDGQISNLRRFKDDVKSVDSGQECGMTFENFTDMKSGDFVEVFELHEVARTL